MRVCTGNLLTYHEEIVYSGHICPLCKAMTELKTTKGELNAIYTRTNSGNPTDVGTGKNS